MNKRPVIRLLFVAGATGLLLAASLAGLSLGQTAPATHSVQAIAAAQSDGCDTVCVGENCVPIPVDWLGTITITDTFVIYPTSACLCENEDGTKQVEGQGEFFLPNIQTDETDGLSVTFILDWPTLEPQCVQFTGTWEEGVPIGDTGFLLTSLEGYVTFEPEPVLHVSGTIESEQQLPDDSGPAVTGEGTLWINLEEPYDVSFEGTLTVLTLRAIQAAVTLDQSWGFAGSVTLTGQACGGGAYVHVWEEGEDVYGFTGSASLTCTIEAGSLTPEGWPATLPGIPTEDITVAADGELGEFCLECEGDECVEKTYGLWAGTELDLNLPETVVEPGTVTARFFVSPTGILSATTNLQRCRELETDPESPVPHSAFRTPHSDTALFCLNQAPTITITSPSVAGDQPDTGGIYTIRWTAEDPDDDVVVSLYYDRDGTGRDGRLIACCLSEGDGSYNWDTSEVGSGTYYIYGRIDDGKNLAAVSYSAGTVKVVDSTPPARPGTPSVSLEGGEIELSWQPNAEDDVVGYRVHYGSEPGVYPDSYDATNVTSFRLPRQRTQPPGLPGSGHSDMVSLRPAQRPRYLAVSAYDSSGNSSPPSLPARLWFVYMPAVLKNPR